MSFQILNISLIALIFVGARVSDAQAQKQVEGKTIIPLRITKPIGPPMIMVGIHFDNQQKTQDGYLLGEARGGVLVGVQPLNDQDYSYKVRVDSNRDQDLTNETTHVLLPNTSIEVMVLRSTKTDSLPYTLAYRRSATKDAKAQERFFWAANYWAEGELRIGGCKALFVLTDKNFDGVFDERDAATAPNVGLDLNGDGKIGTAGEWHNGKQIVEFCGMSMIIESIEPDGSAVTLAQTRLRVAKVGEQVPPFALTTLKGKAIRSNDLKGIVTLLDFWASWCNPCVERFPVIKEMVKRFGNRLEVITVNVDEPSRRERAKQIIRKYKLGWPQVMSGKGSNDSIWMIFGGMEKNEMMIPLYVLIDESGRVRYVGQGGEGLLELQAMTEQLLPVRKPKKGTDQK